MTQQHTPTPPTPVRLLPDDHRHLPDDTEESVVGTEWHQAAMRILVNALQDVAERAHPTWHVGDQLTLIGPQPGGLWRPKPDVSVHPTAGPQLRRELDTRPEGLPTLAFEVLSATTWERDLMLEENPDRPLGKAWGYLEMWGVPEYLAFDPQGEFIPGQVRAWKRVGGQTENWEPGPSGRYESVLGVSFAVEGSLLRVYDEQGQPVRFSLEKNTLLKDQARQLADEQAARRENEERLAELEAELRRLRDEGT
jgi:Uma2 family endonuclease